MRLLHAPQTSTTAGKLFQQRGISRVADSGARWAPAASFPRAPGNATGALVLRLKPTQRIALSSVGSRNRTVGNRPAQAAPDGKAPENAEAVAREQFVEKAKAESASTIDDEQVPFRDAVESGQTIGEATTDLQFGADDGKQGKSGEAIKAEDKHKEDPKAEMNSEVWAAKDDGGSTHSFLDDEKKVDFRGEEDESVLGIGGQRTGEREHS